YVHGYADARDGALAVAALRVFAEQSDLVRGRELTMLAIGDDLSGLALTPGDHPGITVHCVSGGTDERLPVALKAAGAARVPLLGFLDASAATAPPLPETVAALAAGKPAEVLMVLAPGAVADLGGLRAELRTAGFPLVTAVELATGEEPGELLVYA